MLVIALHAGAPVLHAACIAPGPPCDEFWKASAVFIGTVTSITPVPVSGDPFQTQNLRVHFTIGERFTGANDQTVDLFTYEGSESTHFSVGETYFVYAYVDTQTGQLNDAGCGLTKPLEYADADVTYARTAIAGRTSGEIFGQLLHWEQESRTGVRFEEPLAGAPVSLKSEDGIIRTTTADHDGSYSFTGLSAGQYTIRTPAPPGTYLIGGDLGQYGPVELTNPRSCVNIDFAYHWDGRASGRVVTAGGEPVRGLAVSLLKADEDDYVSVDDRIVRTDQNGEFRMIHLEPHHYRLGFDVRESKSVSRFRPGSPTIDVTVGEGERVRVRDLIVPPELTPGELVGTVVTTDGKPSKDIRIFVQDSDDAPLGVALVTDAEGSFKTGVFRGRTYRLRTDNPGVDITVVITESPFVVRITVPR